MFSLLVLLFMALFTVALAHRYDPPGLIPQVLVVVLVFSLDPPTDPIKLNLLYQSFENMVVSIGLHGHSLLLACIYRPPGSCTLTFWKNSCHLVVSCHLLTLHIISVVTSTFMLMFQLVRVINL